MPLDKMTRSGLQQQIGRLMLMLVAITIGGTLGYMAIEDWGPSSPCT